REQGGDIWVAIDGNTVDLVPGQGELFAAFTDFVEIVEGREGDIGHDAPVLGALPGNPVELRLGELELALRQGQQGLHRALAETLGAHHQAAPVVLDGAGKDLRCRGAQAVDQHHQRPVVHRRLAGAVLAGNHLVGVADLYHRARVDEQVGEGGGFMEGPAAVVAQVDDDAVDILRPEFFQQEGHVPGGTLEIGVALVEGLEIDVEGGDVDHPDAVL